MQKLSRLAVNEEGFAFDPGTGDSYVLNGSGLALLRGLREGKNEEELAQDLSQRYDVPSKGVVGDIIDFLTRLRALQLA